MCIPLPKSRKPRTHPVAIYRLRASLAHCITNYGYRRVNDAAADILSNSADLLCFQCKELIPAGTLTYRLSLTHSIRIGRTPSPDRCECCRTPLAFIRGIEHCDVCSDAYLLALRTLPEFDLDIENVDSRLILNSTDAPADIIVSRRLANFSLSLLERE